MFLFFSVARSQENGSWERATETAQGNGAQTAGASSTAAAPAKAAAKVAVSKNGVNPNFGMNMPMMVSAFDTAAWLKAAA
ncbi:MAG: hypothetical protein JNL85_06010 [Rubrivivax sp.]|nr:hypothetical protein [Rubrivivax sp.]